MSDTRYPNRPPDGDWLGSQYLRFERRGSLGVVTVDRPERRNALTPSMYFGIRAAVERVSSSTDLAGLLLTGTGDVFVPGGDLSGGNDDAWGDLTVLGMDITPFDAIRHAPKPVVCAINGLAQGGGLMMSMLADVSVASDRATFRAPELLRGIADTYYGQILPRQIGPARARDMLMTGRVVSAQEALAWGLVSRVVPHEQLLDEAIDALQWCCRSAPGARNEIKRIVDRYYGVYDRMAMDASLAGPESREGMTAFGERRNPNWVPDDLRTDGRL